MFSRTATAEIRPTWAYIESKTGDSAAAAPCREFRAGEPKFRFGDKWGKEIHKISEGINTLPVHPRIKSEIELHSFGQDNKNPEMRCIRST